jgi:hypothetical protein
MKEDIPDEPIELSLVYSIDSEHLRDLATDAGELALDLILDDGVLREIPFFGTLIRIGGAFRSARERLFARRVANFLLTLASTPHSQRQSFVNELQDNKQAQRIGETLVGILDRLDDVEKARYIAKVFASYIRGQIDFETTRRFFSVIDRIFLPDLLRFVDGWETESFLTPDRSTGLALELSTLGLMTFRADWQQIQRQQRLDTPARHIKLIQYDQNELGRKFREIMRS